MSDYDPGDLAPIDLEGFNKIPDGEVFATGITDNAPGGLFMTNEGGRLRWVAKKLLAGDWAIYCFWDCADVNYVVNYGDKVQDTQNIANVLPVTDEVLNLYRH